MHSYHAALCGQRVAMRDRSASARKKQNRVQSKLKHKKCNH